MNKKLKITFLNVDNQLTIISFGPMYPNDREIYLRDLQSNSLSISSENLYFEYRGPIFLRSEVIRFGKDLELLLQRKISRTLLIADEEDIEIKVIRKGNDFQVEFNFSKIDLKHEKWEYYKSFRVYEKNLDDIRVAIKQYAN